MFYHVEHMLNITGGGKLVTCKVKHFYNILHPWHSRGKSTVLKHFCKCFILHVTMV